MSALAHALSNAAFAASASAVRLWSRRAQGPVVVGEAPAIGAERPSASLARLAASSTIRRHGWAPPRGRPRTGVNDSHS